MLYSFLIFFIAELINASSEIERCLPHESALKDLQSSWCSVCVENLELHYPRVLSDELHYHRVLSDELHYPRVLSDELHYPRVLSDELHYHRVLSDELHYPRVLSDQLHYPRVLSDQLHYPRVLSDQLHYPRVLSDVLMKKPSWFCSAQRENKERTTQEGGLLLPVSPSLMRFLTSSHPPFIS